MGESVPFTILRFRRVPPRRDGTEARNSFTVDVEVRGEVHELRVRRSSGAVKVPPALHGDPLVPAIQAAAVDFIVTAAQAVYRERRGRRGPAPPPPGRASALTSPLDRVLREATGMLGRQPFRGVNPDSDQAVRGLYTRI